MISHIKHKTIYFFNSILFFCFNITIYYTVVSKCWHPTHSLLFLDLRAMWATTWERMEQYEWVERTEWTEWNEWDEWDERAKRTNRTNRTNWMKRMKWVLTNEFCEMSEQESDVARWGRNKSEWVGWQHLLTTCG